MKLRIVWAYDSLYRRHCWRVVLPADKIIAGSHFRFAYEMAAHMNCVAGIMFWKVANE